MSDERVVKHPRRAGLWCAERREGGKLCRFVTGAKTPEQARRMLREPAKRD